MSNNVPMGWWSFHKYISSSRQQNDWIDNFYKLGFDGLADKITSYDHVLELLAYIFNDTADIINRWAYECNYGRDNNAVITYNNQEYKPKKIYMNLFVKYLIKKLNGQM